RDVTALVVLGDDKGFCAGGSATNPEGVLQVGCFDKGALEPRFMVGSAEFTDPDAFGYIHAIQQCNDQICVMDSNMRDMLVFTMKGEMVGEVDMGKLLGLRYPWINDFQMVDQTAWVIAANNRENSELAEGIVYRVRGFDGAAAPATPTDAADDAGADAPADDAPADVATDDTATDAPNDDGASKANVPSASKVVNACTAWEKSVKDFG